MENKGIMTVIEKLLPLSFVMMFVKMLLQLAVVCKGFAKRISAPL